MIGGEQRVTACELAGHPGLDSANATRSSEETRRPAGLAERPSGEVSNHAGESPHRQSGDAQSCSPRRRGGSALAVECDAVKLHSVIDEAEAELFGNSPLQRFQLLVDEFDDAPGLDIDQMVVVRVGRGFVA